VSGALRCDGADVGTTEMEINPARGAAAAAGSARLAPVGLEPRLEAHRDQLRRHCRRMLGSAFEADDAVQETLVRAWRSFDRFDGRATLRSWLYRIATNVCLDMLRGQQRRAAPADLGPGSAGAGARAASPGPSGTGSGAVTQGWPDPADDDPAEVVASREDIRRAFGVALRRLPSRQRSVLILREVLRWRADEVAELLGTTTASVNSALQRARATLSTRDVSAAHGPEPDGDAERRLLGHYVDAFARSDVDSLVSLLRLDHHTAEAPAA
jgi:RNA polymerase sigma-70 factor (ECF subfamily)